MAIQQLSVFVENQKGKLLGTVKTLADAGINIRAMSIADTKDFGILRLITSDNQKAMEVLADESIVNTTRVIAAKMEDRAGALYQVLQISRLRLRYLVIFVHVDEQEPAHGPQSLILVGKVNAVDIVG